MKKIADMLVTLFVTILALCSIIPTAFAADMELVGQPIGNTTFTSITAGKVNLGTFELRFDDERPEMITPDYSSFRGTWDPSGTPVQVMAFDSPLADWYDWNLFLYPDSPLRTGWINTTESEKNPTKKMFFLGVQAPESGTTSIKFAGETFKFQNGETGWIPFKIPELEPFHWADLNVEFSGPIGSRLYGNFFGEEIVIPEPSTSSLMLICVITLRTLYRRKVGMTG